MKVFVIVSLVIVAAGFISSIISIVNVCRMERDTKKLEKWIKEYCNNEDVNLR